MKCVAFGWCIYQWVVTLVSFSNLCHRCTAHFNSLVCFVQFVYKHRADECNLIIVGLHSLEQHWRVCAQCGQCFEIRKVEIRALGVCFQPSLSVWSLPITHCVNGILTRSLKKCETSELSGLICFGRFVNTSDAQKGLCLKATGNEAEPIREVMRIWLPA